MLRKQFMDVAVKGALLDKRTIATDINGHYSFTVENQAYYKGDHLGIIIKTTKDDWLSLTSAQTLRPGINELHIRILNNVNQP